MICQTNRIEAVFSELRQANRTALMPYLMAGYPNRNMSVRLLQAVAKAGADLIEFGIPYSDPMADGPTIQAAGEVALSNGINTDTVFEMISEARAKIETPIVIMTYYNTIYRYGLERFAVNAKKAGVDGVITPDLPHEEAKSWQYTAKETGLDSVMLVAPTSTDERIAKVVNSSEGFIYCVSLAGVTGARTTLPPQLTEFMGRVRAATNKPLAVGFGIATAEQAKDISRIADGVIIGSALVSLITEYASESDTCIDEVVSYISSIRKAIDS